MKYEVVGVFDLAAEMWSQPMFVPALGLAIRSFADECQRQDDRNPYWKHPEDYVMYHIGTWSDDSGKLESVEKRLLLRGVEAAKESKRGSSMDN